MTFVYLSGYVDRYESSYNLIILNHTKYESIYYYYDNGHYVYDTIGSVLYKIGSSIHIMVIKKLIFMKRL